jgi:23S rRNA (guanosine2251-2'-O)-methyltransferase
MSKIYLYGKNPLIEAINSVKAGNTNLIGNVYLNTQAEADPKIVSALQSAKISYEKRTGQEIESLVGKNIVHQGVCAEIDEKALYSNLDEVLEKSESLNKQRLFILLDELEDPHNVGAIIRSAVAFGADAILIPEHNQTGVTGTVIKSSAGMVFQIPIVKIGNINNVVRELKDKRFWIYGLTGDGDTELNNSKFDSDTVIIIGSEGEGIREQTLKLCDFRLSIPIDKKCESLNASNAVAITL